MKRTFLAAVASALIISTLQSQTIKSPDEFLGYELGTQFTYHHRAVEYFKYIADNSPLAEYREYGTSYEGRPLGVCFISSEENLANLEEYRKNNLIKTGLLKGEFTGKQLLFIWLGYNVHGNEAVGMEAAMKTLYTLVTGSYQGVSEYLKGCIIVIDPWHDVITPWQHEFHKLMGNGNATLFNEKFRLYFTKENFDLFYPNYGDTWPLFNGAMGFTYEQSGGGGSGLAYKLESGDTLALKERIDGHFTASMATIKVSYENREKLISEFNRYFEENEKNPLFQYKSVIIKGTNEKSNIGNLLQLFDRNQIRYIYAGSIGKK